jgi:hypothetical protein
MAGLSMLLASAWRTSRRGSAARRGLRQSRQETAAVSRDRDDLIDQRETARAYAAGAVADGTRHGDQQAGTGPRERVNGEGVDAPSETPAP